MTAWTPYRWVPDSAIWDTDTKDGCKVKMVHYCCRKTDSNFQSKALRPDIQSLSTGASHWEANQNTDLQFTSYSSSKRQYFICIYILCWTAKLPNLHIVWIQTWCTEAQISGQEISEEKSSDSWYLWENTWLHFYLQQGPRAHCTSTPSALHTDKSHPISTSAIAYVFSVQQRCTVRSWTCLVQEVQDRVMGCTGI